MAQRHESALPAAVLSKNVPTSVVAVNGRKHLFQLTSPIDLEAGWQSDRYVIAFEPLHLSVYGRDEEQAYSAFAEMFEMIWEEIADAPDDSLTADAQGLKRLLRQTVKNLAARQNE
jgi:hypothetical protein